MAFVVEAGFVFVAEAMASAGDVEVVVAVQPQLHRAVQPARRDGRDAGERRRLRFLAAEAAAHAPALDLHMVRAQVQRARHQVLHLARVLGRAVHLHAVVFLRNRVADLAFEVELLLPADVPCAVQAMRRGVDGGARATRRAASVQVHRRQHVLTLGVRFFGCQHGVQRLRVQHVFGERRGAAGRVARGCDHREHRLAHVAQFAVGQDRLVVHDGAAVVRAGNVSRRHHPHHAGQGANALQRHARQAAMRHG